MKIMHARKKGKVATTVCGLSNVANIAHAPEVTCPQCLGDLGEKTAPEPPRGRDGCSLDWLVVNPNGKLLAVLDSESEAFHFTRNRGHAHGAVFFKAPIDYAAAPDLKSALEVCETQLREHLRIFAGLYDAQAALSKVLSDPDGSNDDVRDAAVSLCMALNAMHASNTRAQAKPRVVLFMDGGLVHEIVSDLPVEYMKVDFDVEGSDEEDRSIVPEWGGNTEACVECGDAEVDQECVGKYFNREVKQ